MNFTFSVKGTNGLALSYPNQLKNELKFADSQNPYINFYGHLGPDGLG